MNTTTTTEVQNPVNGYAAEYGYTYSAQSAQSAPADGPRLDQVRYWVGAAITAVIAALISLVALVVAQGIVHVPVEIGADPVHGAIYGVCAAGIALLAAALFDGMVHVAPRPVTYYSWLAAIVTLLAGLLPFTTTAGLHSQIALSLTNVCVGLIVTLLVPIAASNARR